MPGFVTCRISSGPRTFTDSPSSSWLTDLLRHLVPATAAKPTASSPIQWNGVADSDRSTIEIGTRLPWPIRRERRSASPTG